MTENYTWVTEEQMLGFKDSGSRKKGAGFPRNLQGLKSHGPGRE
jgi:hypothetical protein